MIYKKDLLSKIESLESQLERFRGTNFGEDIKEINQKIDAILNYLDCEVKIEKTIETRHSHIYGSLGYMGFLPKDYILETKKLVKKTKTKKNK